MMKKLFAFATTFGLLLLSSPLVHAEFFDVPQSYRYHDAIEYVQSKNFVKGYEDGSFKPSNRINRAEFTKILIGARFTEDQISNCSAASLKSFKDVDAHQWFAKYVCVAKKEGSINGYPDGTFRPGQEVNYAEAAKIIVNTYGIKISEFPGAEWYEPFLAVLKSLKSSPETVLEANQFITRGEMAYMMQGVSQTFDNLKPGESLEISVEVPVNNGGLSNINPANNLYKPTERPPIGTLAQLKQSVIDLTNAERAKFGLRPLSNSALLETSAQKHSDDMLDRKFFSHDNPSGITPSQRIEAIGYLKPFYDCDCTKSYATGENIAKGQETAVEVLETWMNSPKHRENILNPDYAEIGIGITAVSQEEKDYVGYFWVQNFGNIMLTK